MTVVSHQKLNLLVPSPLSYSMRIGGRDLYLVPCWAPMPAYEESLVNKLLNRCKHDTRWDFDD